MDEERFRDLIGSCPLPYGTQENPDEVLDLWKAWEAAGISKPVRNIEKGQELSSLPSPLRPPPRGRNQPEGKLFTFDEDDAEKAIRINRE
jgi:hypothetical protein